MIEIYIPREDIGDIHGHYYAAMIRSLLWNRFQVEAHVEMWHGAAQTIRGMYPPGLDRETVVDLINDAFDLCCRESDVPAWIVHKT